MALLFGCHEDGAVSLIHNVSSLHTFSAPHEGSWHDWPKKNTLREMHAKTIVHASFPHMD
jgi:hypothetical protein